MTKKEFVRYLGTLSHVDYTYNKYQWGRVNVVDNLELFNELARHAFSFGPLRLTRNGHLSSRGFITNGAIWDVEMNENSSSSISFILLYDAKLYTIVFRPSTKQDVEEVTGLEALKEFKNACKIHLKPFAMSNNDEIATIKSTIPKYNIGLTEIGDLLRDQELENCFHIDINSAFPAGLVARHPEFGPFFNYHYERRKEGPLHKAIMNYAIGAMQSLKIRGDRYPTLARDAIDWTNKQLKLLTKRLTAKKYIVLGYNTDGIFVMRSGPDQPLYTDHSEGKAMGQWKIAHVYDKLRFKSAGSYEYIENGKYKPVMRGHSSLDKIKPRAEWEWGDIYKTKEVRYLLDLDFNRIREVEFNG